MQTNEEKSRRKGHPGYPRMTKYHRSLKKRSCVPLKSNADIEALSPIHCETLSYTTVVPFLITIKLYKYSVVSYGQVNSTLYMIKGY